MIVDGYSICTTTTFQKLTWAYFYSFFSDIEQNIQEQNIQY